LKTAAVSLTPAEILFLIIFVADLRICGDLSTEIGAAMLKSSSIVQMNKSAHYLKIASLFTIVSFILHYHLIPISVFIHANYLHTIRDSPTG